MGSMMHTSPPALFLLHPASNKPPTLSPPSRPHPPLGRRTISAPFQAEVKLHHCCGGSKWCALQHEPCVGAAEMLFNLYNKKYIAFFCSFTQRGVSVFLAVWHGIATRMEAGFVFSELTLPLLPFTSCTSCEYAIRCYLKLHISLWVQINVLCTRH